MSAWGKTCDKCGAKNHFAVVCGKQRPPPNRKKSKDKPKDRHPKSKVNIVFIRRKKVTAMTTV